MGHGTNKDDNRVRIRNGRQVFAEPDGGGIKRKSCEIKSAFGQL